MTNTTSLPASIVSLLMIAVGFFAPDEASGQSKAQGLSGRGLAWSCPVEVTHFCSKETCNTQRRRDATFVIDFAAERYRFCAESGLATDQKCTEWKRMQHWTYGDYTFIGDSIGDQLFEVLNDGSRFIQAQGVVGGNTLVRYGRCERR